VSTNPRKKEVWAPPEPEEEAMGGLRAGAAGAPATSGSSPPSKKKMLTTGVGYSGRAALRREQCDVRAVGLRSRRFLVMARPLNNVKAEFSMSSGPRLYN
jgi:hypothetical protein